MVEEESDETMYWLELLCDSGLVEHEKVKVLERELNEILSIMVAALRTTREKEKRKLRKPKGGIYE